MQTESEVESFFLGIDRIFNSDLFLNENYIHPYIKVQALRGKVGSCESIYFHYDTDQKTCFTGIGQSHNTSDIASAPYDAEGNMDLRLSFLTLPNKGNTKVVKITDS